MNTIASPPVLPLEIFGCIISHLVQDPNVLRYRPEKLDAVNQCSVVSKDFASLCQPYVFRVIDFVGFHGHEELKLKKFVQTVTRNPNLSRHVRDLSLTFSESERCLLTRAEISRAIDVLLGFSNLQKLYISRSYDDQRRFRLPRRIRAFLDDMINTYTSGGTLKSLGLNDLDNVSVSDLLNCPTLKDVRLGRIPLPSITVPATNITIFTIHSVPTVDLSILSYLPNLKELAIRAVDSLIPPSPNCGVPSLQLKSLDLRLHSPGDASALVAFYTGFARLQDTQAFKYIEKLEYESPFEEDIEALEIILNESKPLKELQFDSAPHFSPPAGMSCTDILFS